MLMYLQKEISKKLFFLNLFFKLFFVSILSATEEKSRIRIRTKMSRIHSPTLQEVYFTGSLPKKK